MKLINLLKESVIEHGFLNRGQLINVLQLLEKTHPRLRIKLKDYLRHSTNMDFVDNYVYRTISNFLKVNLGINSKSVEKQVALTYLINPDVTDFKKDELFFPEDMYFTIVEYTDEDYEITDDTDWEECPECEGWGTEECDECDGSGKDESCDECGGSGEIEDPNGEEGDTITCEECGGDGEMNCYRCDGAGKYECNYCGGGGDVEVEYEKYELTTITDYYISYAKLPEKVRSIMDSSRAYFSMDYFYEWDDTYILWRRNYTSQDSKNGSDDINDDPNELLNYPKSEKINFRILQYFL